MAQFYLFQFVQWMDNSGNPLSGGKVNTYMAGSSSPLATYTDSTGATPNANPVILDSAGRAQLWLAASSYKFVVTDSAGGAIATIDGFNPQTAGTTLASLISTGDITLQRATAATSGANQSSNNLKITSRFWTGAADATNTWNVDDILGAGSNPTTTLTIAQAGTTGQNAVHLLAIPLRVGDGTAAVPSLSFVNGTDTGWFKQAVGVIGATISGTCRWLFNATGAIFGSGGAVAWSSNADPSAAGGDSFLARVAAKVLSIGSTNGGTDGELRLAKVNKVTITQPATGSTLTIADGKTLTANSSTTIAGTDGKTLTVNNSMTTAGADGETIVGLAATQSPTNKTFDNTSNVPVRLSDTLLGGTATNITFSSISGSYKHLQIVMQSRGDGAVTLEGIQMQLNADTGANYDTQSVSGTNAAAGASEQNAATSGGIGVQPGANVARAGIAGATVIFFPNYAAATFEKQAIATSGAVDSTAANSQSSTRTVSWRNTAAITAIKLFPQTSTNFVAGTRATLYGLP